MLVEKSVIEKGGVSVFKFTSGEEVIATIVEIKDNELKVKDVYTLAATETGVGFVSPMMMATPESIVINRNAVIMYSLPSEGMLTGYKSAVSGISLPSAKSIIV
jgi:hypothetical protein